MIHIPPPVSTSTDAVMEHVASFVMFTCMLGNDYLAGLKGAPRRWSYAAYVEMMRRFPGQTLVRILRNPSAPAAVFSTDPDAITAACRAPMIIHAGVHQRLISFCYYMNLVAQACKTNKPTIAIDRISYDQTALAVAQKFSNANKQMPDAKKRIRMLIRLQWVLHYFAHGSTTIRKILDPLEFGWEDEWRHIVV